MKHAMLTRRKFLLDAGAATLGSLTMGSVRLRGQGGVPRNPPNIVYIVCDQMRGDAMGCVGNPMARTPNLDRLAAGGVLFERWFSNSPVCAPSRVSAFTGLYPHQHGKLTNESGAFIGSLENTLLGSLREQGYRLGWIGKNHTCTTEVLHQLDVTHIRAREKFRAYSPFVPPYWHSDTLWPRERCNPVKNTDDGIAFLRESKRSQPFFLHLSYFDPHPPYMAPSEFTSRYCASEMTLPPYVPPEHLSERLAEQQRALRYDRIRDSDLLETMRYYYAAIEWGVDYQVGRILRALEDEHLLEDTLILFTADHGDFMGHHRMVRKAMFLYDSLLHVPMIWYAPGLIRRGHRVADVAQHADIFPTLADFAEGRVPGRLPGTSRKPWLTGERTTTGEGIVFAAAAYSDLPRDYFNDPEPLYRADSEVPFHTRVQNLTWKAEEHTGMVRTRDWKLIRNSSRPDELYGLNGGTVERENVYGQPGTDRIRETLKAKLEQLWPAGEFAPG